VWTFFLPTTPGSLSANTTDLSFTLDVFLCIYISNTPHTHTHTRKHTHTQVLTPTCLRHPQAPFQLTPSTRPSRWTCSCSSLPATCCSATSCPSSAPSGCSVLVCGVTQQGCRCVLARAYTYTHVCAGSHSKAAGVYSTCIYTHVCAGSHS